MRNFSSPAQVLLVWHSARATQILPLSERFAATFPSDRS